MFSSVSNLLGGKSQDHHHHQTSEHSNEKEQSLTTVLSSSDDRTALLLLIANCTESMRKTVCDNFDPRLTTKKPNTSFTNSILDLGGERTEQEKQEDAAQREQQERQRRIEELGKPETQELKKAALAYFDDWRDRVLERVGEAINARPAIEDQKEKAEAKVSDPPQHVLDKSSTGDDVGSDVPETALHSLYPPRDTTLSRMPTEQRALILHSLLLLVLGMERYPSESRVLLLQIAGSLKLPLSALTGDETKVAQGLLDAAKQQMSADESTKKKAQENAESRKWKVGLGTVAGAALIGVTGGLAAPLLAAGVSPSKLAKLTVYTDYIIDWIRDGWIGSWSDCSSRLPRSISRLCSACWCSVWRLRW